PTRSEVDKAHRTNNWLDIGIPSFHNVLSSSLGKRKKFYWWMLALSSLPLHLCYNSVIYMSLSAQTYAVIEFGPETKAAIENNTYHPSNLTMDGWGIDNRFFNHQIYADAYRAGRLQELSLRECIDAYSTAFQSTRGNVFLVVDKSVMPTGDVAVVFPKIDIDSPGTCSATTGTEWVYKQFKSRAGKCLSQETDRFLPMLQANTSTWAPLNGHPVKRCLSEPTGQKCKLNFNVPLAIVVIVFNAIKALTVLAAIIELRNDPLLTIGDAAASFLETPDSLSENMCLISQKDIHGTSSRLELQKPLAYTIQRPTWASSVKEGKLHTVWLSLFTAIALLASLLAWGYSSIRGQKNIDSVLRIGLSSADPRTIIRSTYISSHGFSGIIQNTLLANGPQVILSMIYFSYNATITSMLVAHEWSGFFSRSKSLRVSNNVSGLQRSTYFLQLPYRYALPLLAFSALLQWLASQSLSVVQIFVPSDQRWEIRCGSDFVTLSYSPLGILLSLIVIILLSTTLFILGRKKLSSMPVVGSCSAAIAASCHAGPSEQVPWEKNLKWGALAQPTNARGFHIGHCGLTSSTVERPVAGAFY
ncbi:hypothetical protein DE146DRAFT_766784, partial [Phaeosphaeria sp. MPI-PUGE-AT-0046c]